MRPRNKDMLQSLMVQNFHFGVMYSLIKYWVASSDNTGYVQIHNKYKALRVNVWRSNMIFLFSFISL
ncbi:hypothetical protein HanHA300_Chr03g0083311 [Helianthus annuus]|nr:hypothetical protein HanHA300_Chr03g0083311 [Helianthus annuus]KAJ0607277.1 hypothetical protein HanHA89_Chr03g0094811 [Helianthus annuus]KAJ0767337.1 hypothetical protein HanLR1_Chr03g0088111 [Helianthus annuus]